MLEGFFHTDDPTRQVGVERLIGVFGSIIKPVSSKNGVMDGIKHADVGLALIGEWLRDIGTDGFEVKGVPGLMKAIGRRTVSFPKREEVIQGATVDEALRTGLVRVLQEFSRTVSKGLAVGLDAKTIIGALLSHSIGSYPRQDGSVALRGLIETQLGGHFDWLQQALGIPDAMPSPAVVPVEQPHTPPVSEPFIPRRLSEVKRDETLVITGAGRDRPILQWMLGTLGIMEEVQRSPEILKGVDSDKRATRLIQTYALYLRTALRHLEPELQRQFLDAVSESLSSPLPRQVSLEDFDEALLLTFDSLGFDLTAPTGAPTSDQAIEEIRSMREAWGMDWSDRSRLPRILVHEQRPLYEQKALEHWKDLLAMLSACQLMGSVMGSKSDTQETPRLVWQQTHIFRVWVHSLGRSDQRVFLAAVAHSVEPTPEPETHFTLERFDELLLGSCKDFGLDLLVEPQPKSVGIGQV